MNGFINHIINRHMNAEVNVLPRLPGRFEPPATLSYPAWQQQVAVTNTIQTAEHSDMGKSTEINEPQKQEPLMAEFQTPPVATPVQTVAHSDVGKSTEMNYPQEQETPIVKSNTQAVTASIQTVAHSDMGKSTEINDRKKQEPPMTASHTKPVATSSHITGYTTGEENRQPSPVKVANRNDASQSEKIKAVEDVPPGEKIRTVEFVPFPPHFVQSSIATRGIKTILQPEPLIYEPISANKQVKEQAGEKSLPLVSSGLLQPASKKQTDKQSSSGVTPVPAANPVTRSFHTARRSGTGSLQEGQQTPQIIKVSIGRIEVRAVQAAGPVKTARVEPPKPKLSLDEYLNKRNSNRS